MAPPYKGIEKTRETANISLAQFVLHVNPEVVGSSPTQEFFFLFNPKIRKKLIVTCVAIKQNKNELFADPGVDFTKS